ncbi:MAG: queuosine salvage family protein [Planctomycetota bacterium]
MIVLESIRAVVEQARHCSIDDAAIEAWASEVAPAELEPSAHELLGFLPGSQDSLANLVLLIDSLNFCFWSANPIRIEWRGKRYERFNAMFISIMLAAKYEPRWCDAEFWVSVPGDELREVLGGKGELLLMDEREGIVRETGRVLLERFDGQFMNAIESVNWRAWPLAVLLMTNFDSFRDVSSYRYKPVYFLKRAQICALDTSIAFQTHGHQPLKGLDELTAFADYRVPQALRHLGIVNMTAESAQAIDSGQEWPRDSEEEIEIRAATIEAVDRMKEALRRAGKAGAAWRVDWYLWVLSHHKDVAVNHHRTRTVYY